MKSFRLAIFSFGLMVFLSLQPEQAYSQCAMCRAQVESNLDNGKTVGKGLNDGILYLMTIPYLVIGGFGYMVYRNWKNSRITTNQ
jgi:hypothetical protein